MPPDNSEESDEFLNELEKVIGQAEETASELPKSEKIHEEMIGIVEEFFYSNAIINFRENLSHPEVKKEFELCGGDVDDIERQFGGLFRECQKVVNSGGAEQNIDIGTYRDFKSRLKETNDNASSLLAELEAHMDIDSCRERISQFKENVESLGRELEVSRYRRKKGEIGVSIGFGEGETERDEISSEEIRDFEDSSAVPSSLNGGEKEFGEPDKFKEKPRKSEKFQSVPPFEAYYPSVSMMNKDARSFYEHWLEGWREGDPIGVDGNISYIFVYVYEVLSWRRENRYEEIISELEKLRQVYGHEEKIYDHLGKWVADTYIVLGKYGDALETLKSNSRFHMDSTYFSLKRKLGLPLEGKDILPKWTSTLTDYGRANVNRVAEALSMVFRKYEEDNQTELIEEVTNHYHPDSWWGKFPIYSATPENEFIDDLDFYKFDTMKAKNLISPGERSEENMIRRAENRMRTEEGEPKVGEGWVSKEKRKEAKKKLKRRKGEPSKKKKTRTELRKENKKRRLCHAKIQKSINAMADREWDAALVLLEDAMEGLRKELVGYGYGSIDKDKIRRDFKEFGHYLNADQKLTERAKAAYVVTRNISGSFKVPMWGELLFEDFTFPWLADSIDDQNLVENPGSAPQIFSCLGRWRNCPDDEKMRFLKKISLGDRPPLFERASGLSFDAKRLLKIMIRRKKDIDLLPNFGGYHYLLDPESAVRELSDRELALANNEIQSKDLLRALTLKQLKKHFYKKGIIPWSGNKSNKIESIAGEYPDGEIRNVVHSECEGTILKRTWKFDNRLLKSMRAQSAAIRILIGKERRRIDSGEERWRT